MALECAAGLSPTRHPMAQLWERALQSPISMWQSLCLHQGPWGASPPVHALHVSESLLPRAECDAAVCIPVHYQIMNTALPHSETFLLTKCCTYSQLSLARFC